MRALVARSDRNGPSVEEIAPPELGAHDVRIRVVAAAVNPADVHVASGDLRGAVRMPDSVGLGWDVSGTVVEVGSGAGEKVVVGDAVAALHDRVFAPTRSHAEFVTVPAAATAVIPPALDPVAAASIPLNALTAAQALDLLGPSEGRALLVTGAAGAVGGYAVALAARAGWRVTGLVRAHDQEFVRRAGAVQTVVDIPDGTYDAVLDAAALQGPALAACRDGGAVVGVKGSAGLPSERGITTSVVSVRHDGDRLRELLDLSCSGELEVRVAGQVPLADAVTAYGRVSSGGQRGRWLLTP